MPDHRAAMAAQLLLPWTGLVVGGPVVGRTVPGPRQLHVAFPGRTLEVADGGPAGRVLFAGAACRPDVRIGVGTGLDVDDLQICFSWLSNMVQTCFHVVHRADMSVRSSRRLESSSCR